MSLPPDRENDIFSLLIARVFQIGETIWGGPKDPFVVSYRGRLRQDSVEAYDQLAADLRPHGHTPLFREEEGREIIHVIEGIAEPRESNPLVNLALFLITLVSVLLAGAAFVYDGADPESLTGFYLTLFANINTGLPFAVSLLAILLAHEFGHYLAARYHKTAVTLPYFLPLPLPTSFGTLGAFIQLKEPPRNKRILLDIGIAGPLAGLVVAIPIVLYGIFLSEVSPIPTVIPAGEGVSLEGNSILYLAAKYLIKGQLLPAPLSYEGVNPFLYWLRFIFTGRPLPLGGTDIFLHPVAWAGWAGLLVTALNLIPAGQLDGGHVLYGLLGRRAQTIVPSILIALVMLGFFWSGWWLWAFLIYFLGRSNAQPLDQITRLDPKRRAVAVLGLVIFVLVFTPLPLQVILGPLGP
jgi:membrane-associated protease RseP (regulator of RpoE activity)